MQQFSCAGCGTTFHRYASQVRNADRVYCSRRCAYDNAPKARRRPGRYHAVRAIGHPLADQSGLVGEHRLVLYERIGMGPHACAWCHAPVQWMPGKRTAPGALVVDHVDGNSGNNDAANLVPSCQSCNTWRQRSDKVSDDELFVVDKNGYRHRATMLECSFCGSSFLRMTAQVVQNQRRQVANFCTRSCARRRPKV